MKRYLAFSIAAVTLATSAAAHADDPTTNECLAATESSLKLGNAHQLRAERSQLLVCAAATCPSDIRKECLARVDVVNAEIPTIVFSAKDATGADLIAVRVTMDGERLVDQLEGTSLSIDPGAHTFTFDTAGQTTVTREIVIAEGQKDRRELIRFGVTSVPAPAAPPSAATVGPPPPLASSLASSSLPPPVVASRGLGTQRVVAIVTGGVAIVGVGLGAAFAAIASGRRNDARSECPNVCATQAGVDAWSSAAAAGNMSTFSFLAGGAAAVAAVTLWLTAPHGDRPSTQVGIGPGSVFFKGEF